jgi:hypothetical protein
VPPVAIVIGKAWVPLRDMDLSHLRLLVAHGNIAQACCARLLHLTKA